ncbi:hypothetical protein ACJX0J_026735 [Zea mays]
MHATTTMYTLRRLLGHICAHAMHYLIYNFYLFLAGAQAHAYPGLRKNLTSTLSLLAVAVVPITFTHDYVIFMEGDGQQRSGQQIIYRITFFLPIMYSSMRRPFVLTILDITAWL